MVMRKSKKKLFLMLFISGIIFLCAGIFLSARSTEFERDGIKIQAEIVRIECEYDAKYREEYSVYVKYTVENTTYTRKLDYYASSLYVGLKVPVYYFPDNPSSISYANARFTPVLFYVGAGVCLGFAVFVLCLDRNRSEHLKENWQRVTATVERFDCKKNLRLLGKYPATLTCVDGLKNRYKIKLLCEYAQTFSVGDTVTVYVNNKRYKIDLQEYFDKKL